MKSDANEKVLKCFALPAELETGFLFVNGRTFIFVKTAGRLKSESVKNSF